jgi:hypothetical protein
MEASEAVVDAIIELVAAWNSSDAPAFSALFTEQAQYIGADRISRRGRAQIEEIIRLPAARVRVSIDGPVSQPASPGTAARSSICARSAAVPMTNTFCPPGRDSSIARATASPPMSGIRW